MARALIGITSQMVAARWGDWVREAVLSPQTYSRAVERAGAVPVLVPPIPPGGIPRLIERLDGVLFTGGEDVDPALYGAARHERTDEPDARRDRFELALARAVIEAGPPCSGSPAACTCSTWPGGAPWCSISPMLGGTTGTPRTGPG